MKGAPYNYDEWRREGREVYWEMRRGRLGMDDGRTLTWAAEMNGRMAKMAEELDQLAALRDQLAQLQVGAVITHQPHTNGIDAVAGEYLPSPHDLPINEQET